MPDITTAATEHAITQDLSSLPAAKKQARRSRPALPDADFPLVLRGYDRASVDAYVKRASQLLAELQATRTPEGAVSRALERVGEEVSGILSRAHETAEQITTESRRAADDRLQQAQREAVQITTNARAHLRHLDADTDRIWAERDRIIEDARELARELTQLAEAAAQRFPPIEEEASEGSEVIGEEAEEATVGVKAIEKQTAAAQAPSSNGEVPQA
jgi:FAD/FMN-containing dehydrogenase